MRMISRQFHETGTDFNLSPEQWLSLSSATTLEGSRVLSELCDFSKKQLVPSDTARFVLDTGSVRDGLIDIPINGDGTSKRKSTKKRAIPGDVIISRLRPYLRQVAWIPLNAGEITGQQEFFLSTEFFVFRPNELKHGPMITAWLLSPKVQEIMNEAATGGHHPRISSDMLLSAPVSDKFIDDTLGASLEQVFTAHLENQFRLRSLFG